MAVNSLEVEYSISKMQRKKKQQNSATTTIEKITTHSPNAKILVEKKETEFAMALSKTKQKEKTETLGSSIIIIKSISERCMLLKISQIH